MQSILVGASSNVSNGRLEAHLTARRIAITLTGSGFSARRLRRV